MSAVNGDILVRKEILWTIGKHSIFGLISYYIPYKGKSFVGQNNGYEKIPLGQ